MVRPCSGPASEPNWVRAPKTKERAMSEKLNSKIAVIGIDIGKNSRGAILLRQKWSRGQVLRALFVQAAWVVLVKLGPEHWERYGLKSWIEAAKKRLPTS